MKYIYLIISIFTLLGTSGCVSVYKRENFHVSKDNIPVPKSSDYSLSLSIGSDTKITHVPFIFWYAKDSQPYSMYVRVRFENKIDSPLLIHAVKLTSDGEVIFSKVYSEPVPSSFKMPFKNSDVCIATYTHDLEGKLQFQDGKKAELEVTWEIPGIEDKQTKKVLVIGEESKNTHSLFNHYMSM